MALSSGNREKLNSASRDAIYMSMQRLKEYWNHELWLSELNRYKKNCVAQIKNDIKNRRGKPSHKHLIDYIAASTITHCFDGWTYLGQAFSAELTGNPNVARHLGYYAELRAAMSILASEGIGVFDKKHVVVNSNERCEYLSASGTHEFSCDAIECWADSEKGYETLMKSINPGGLDLLDWLNHYPSSFNFLASIWLKQWGLDLSRIALDREARNIASYRPTTFTASEPRNISKTLKSATDFWEMCEPLGTGGFPILDAHLLRRGIELVFKETHPYEKSRKQAPKSYEREVKIMLNSISPLYKPVGDWSKFLIDFKPKNTPSIILDASGTRKPNHPDHSKQVLARAALLLRAATGSVSDLLESVTSNGASYLEFWWSKPAVQCRLWSGNNTPATFTDLWQDVKESMDSTQEWLDNGGCSYHSLWNEQSSATASLTTTERIALWGLGL